MDDLEDVSSPLPLRDGEVYAPPAWHEGGVERSPGPRQLGPRRFAVALALVTGAVNVALFLFMEAAQHYANRHISFFGDKTVWIPVLWLAGAGAFAAYWMKFRAYWPVLAVAEVVTVLYWSHRMFDLVCQRCASGG